MARNLVTVCLFCLLCATHTTCGSHMQQENGVQTLTDVNLESHHRIEDKRLQQKNRYHQKLQKIRSHRLENEHSNSEVDAHDDSYAEPIDSYAKPIDRRKRHADIDSSQEYIEEIFRLYGNPDSMTMNLTGFNQMLTVLDLHKMIDGGEHKVHSLKTAGVEEETVRCIDSSLLISTLNQETKSKRKTHSHEHSHDHSHGHDHSENISDPLTLTAETLRDVCPILLFQKVANTSLQRTGCIQEHNIIKRKSEIARAENAYSKNTFYVWLYSSLSIVAISACGLFGVAVIPIMHKTYYNHILQFLVALAVGTLCGDALLHLLPHAMSPIDEEDASSHSHDDSMWKGLAAMLGVVFFYFMEKGLTVIVEWRKRRQKLKEDKLPSRVRVLKDDPSGGSGNKGPFTSNSLMKVFKKEDKSEGSQKTCKHKYSEYPYCYDEIETDTHDDHHMRDGQVPPSPKHKAVSVVSSNALNQESKDADPSAKDWLLKPESGLAVEMNNIKHKDDSKELKGEESYTVILREHSRNHHGHSHSHGHVHAPPSSMSSVAWMVIMGDGLHNFTDGMAIGAAFASNIAGGFSTAIAVLCHELPHELGDFAVLLKAGMSVRRAVCYNVLSSALCLAGMVCGVTLGHAPSATRWLFAIAAGTFLYIALVDMMPELSTSHSKEGTLCQCILQLMGLATGIGVMLVIALYEHDLKTLFG